MVDCNTLPFIAAAEHSVDGGGVEVGKGQRTGEGWEVG